MKLTPVTFLKAWQGYSVGEVAGFESDKAQALIAKGFAQAHAGKPPAKPKPQPAPPEIAPTTEPLPAGDDNEEKP